jgi:D-3-phosphoglycerate dehydrogenase
MRVLFVDSVHEHLEQRLTAAGWTCVHDYASPYNRICEVLPSYDGMVIRSRIPVDRSLLEAAMQLKFVARSGAGLENIDLDAAADLGIEVFSSPEGNRDAVGEHCVGMLLMALNHLKRADSEVREGIWRREANRGRELNSLTVGLIGYGHMGSSFAEKLGGFGCRVIAYDKYRAPHPADKAENTPLTTLQTEADVISLHLPETEETRHFIDDEFLAACAKPIVLINTARGIHIDTTALVRALDTGRVVGACLDVLEFERRSFEALESSALPPAFRALLAHESVVLSPHIAGWTHESYIKLSSVLADKLLARFA